MRELFLAPPQSKSDPIIPQDKPVYRILSEKGYFGADDTLHPEGEIIVLHDKPNEDMEPMNDMARKEFEKMADELEASDKLVAQSNGRSFLSRRTKEDLIADASADARRVQTVGKTTGVPLMGGKKRGRPRIERLGQEEIPETGRKDTRGIEVISA